MEPGTEWEFTHKNLPLDAGSVAASAILHSGVILSLPKAYPPVLSPHPPYYTVSSTSNRGKGLFAVRTIPIGQVFLVECPVAVMPRDVSHPTLAKSQLYRALFNGLDEQELLAARELSNCKPSDVCGEDEGIFRTNGVAIEIPVRQELEGTADPNHIGLFIHTSRINHSCGPNAAHYFDPLTFTLSLRAQTVIKEGEEIFISYVQILQPREERRSKLKERYYFDCDCQWCSLSDEAAIAQSDERRSRPAQAWGSSRPEIMTWAADPNTPEDTLIRKNLAFLLEIRSEGLQSVHTVPLAPIFECYGMLGDKKRFKMWGNQLIQSTLGDPGSEPVRQRLSDWVAHPESYQYWNLRARIVKS